MFHRWSGDERLAGPAALVSLAAGVIMLASCSTAPPALENQKAFAKPQLAVDALAAAAQRGDTDALMAIFGPQGREVLSSGDPVADRHQREVFAVALDQQWTLRDLDKRSRELIVGHDQWPFPIPLVKTSGGWQFDTAAGKQEILARRIGRNELAVISICRTYVIAQRAYARESRDGKPTGAYAQKVQSEPGKHDGLYWDASNPGDAPSPLSELAANAEAQGYAAQPRKQLTPFHGYYFRILTQQGQDAPGGARSYLVNGAMTQGFALIAYPAEYGNSGIMTFTVNQDGIVYEADLGEDTVKLAGEIKAYNPDTNWRIVE